MANAPIQTGQNSRRGTPSRLAVQSPDETAIADSLPFGPDEPVNTGHESEVLSAATATNVSVTDGLRTGKC